jgi:hypothetical protein
MSNDIRPEDTLAEILGAFKRGDQGLEDTKREVQNLYFRDLGHTKLDTDRKKRTGYPEVVFCQGKSPQQVRDIFRTMRAEEINILATRMSGDMYRELAEEFPGSDFHPGPGIFTLRFDRWKEVGKGEIAVVSGGTSDFPIAEEAALTASFYGHRVKRYSDVGVAGIHRLLRSIDNIRQARVIIAVAGMEGALAGVLAGLVDKPIIAVPTSVGYGANFQGLSALLTMLNSCAAGISVVNIDNGFGAGYLAGMINAL